MYMGIGDYTEFDLRTLLYSLRPVYTTMSCTNTPRTNAGIILYIARAVFQATADDGNWESRELQELVTNLDDRNMYFKYIGGETWNKALCMQCCSCLADTALFNLEWLLHLNLSTPLTCYYCYKIKPWGHQALAELGAEGEAPHGWA